MARTKITDLPVLEELDSAETKKLKAAGEIRLPGFQSYSIKDRDSTSTEGEVVPEGFTQTFPTTFGY